MRVFVTRPASEAEGWVAQLRQRGFDAVALPLIAIEPAPHAQPLVEAWQRLEHCRAAMFVSGNAVRHFFMQRPGGRAWPGNTRAWATGAGTRQALLDAGVLEAQIDAPPPQSPQFDSETLWGQVMPQVKSGDAILIVRGGDAGVNGDAGRDWLADQLRAARSQVHTVLAYVRQAPTFTNAERDEALRGAADGVWLFSSSQAIANLCALLPAQSWKQAKVVATHPRIAQAARAASFGVVCESRPALDAVAAALESFR